ncbi:MAG: GGDEF domain-containing protein [Treponema sp.]|nr:GGDEF domain-containing protein [Treponema sp.]
MKHLFQKIIFVLLLFSLATALFAQKILVVNTYNPSFPWASSFNLGLQQTAEKSAGKLELFFEDLDITRFSSEEDQQNFARYVTAKYENYPIEGIVGNSDHACAFIEKYLHFAETLPKAYYTSSLTRPSKNTLCLDFEYNETIPKTWNFMSNVQPKISSVFIVAGESLLTENVYNEFLKVVPSNIPIELYKDFTFQELKDKLSTLDRTTGVFFLPLTKDRNGTPAIPKKLLADLTQISSAPIYTSWETLSGTGCVGGEMLSAQKMAQELLAGLQQYIKTETFHTSYSISLPIVDWTAIEKYSLVKEAIPSDALILHKPVPFYITHAKAILILVNILLAAFIFILLTSSILIIRAYRKLRKTNEDLAEARKKAEELFLYDTLTGLFNRRGIEPRIEYELNRKKRFGGSVSLLMVDIDFFKHVNDTYGHDIGDNVLVKVSETLLDHRRSTDLVSRWGGEEFLILLADTEENRAILIAEKIRIACSNIRFSETNNITVSIGVAEVKQDESFESWFKRTDTALYTAKNSGRNKTVSASETCPLPSILVDSVGINKSV